MTSGFLDDGVAERKLRRNGLSSPAPDNQNQCDTSPDATVVECLDPLLPKSEKHLSRINASFVAVLERNLIAAVLPSIPAAISPMHLTLLGLIGAAITSVALIACTWEPRAVLFVPVGLFIHWFGDSFDGSLARYRRIERPSFGFFVDHTADLFALTLIIISFGFSPFFTLTSALLVLTVYLLFSAYTYVKVAVEGVHQLAYGHLGCTEFRLLMGAWSLMAAAFGPQLIGAKFHGFPTIDLVVGVLSICALCGLLSISLRDMAEIDRIENRTKRILSSTPSFGIAFSSNDTGGFEHRGFPFLGNRPAAGLNTVSQRGESQSSASP